MKTIKIFNKNNEKFEIYINLLKIVIYLSNIFIKSINTYVNIYIFYSINIMNAI